MIIIHSIETMVLRIGLRYFFLEVGDFDMFDVI